MFKRIVVELVGPICECEEQKLSWGLHEDQSGVSLLVHCTACKTRLIIPNEVCVATFRFRFDVPYPGKKTAEPIGEGGKVIPFPEGERK